MRTILLVCAALLACGFYIETPESRAERRREEKAWRGEVRELISLRALRVFLRASIEAAPVIEGVDLRKAKVGSRWRFSGTWMKCGDWTFSWKGKDRGGFELYWIYDTQQRNDITFMKSVELSCVRESRTRFRVVAARLTEDEFIELSP